MRKTTAAAGTSLFFAVAPGVVAGLIPWLLTDWRVRGAETWPLSRLVGLFMLAAGAGALIGAFARFVVEGLGTPAPVAPTEHLVVGGLYRYVRNPMYTAVVATILGQALVLGQPVLLAYAVLVAGTVAAFVHLYEEPTLSRRYGAQYDAYRATVPRWLPRRRPRTSDKEDSAEP
ncbi:MAG: isoprenylcysteine carboxylmethyltransferase family protein [Actinomycetota bacterium]|nr:isoprenylcysteine carboxylmethyltransferase family protein [Actinomycetota bacterium]